ncbi:hypothetical protein [Nitrososphaera sp.]|uniref:hypothetical protein n=1 Tax=Nitrososphaera sp. TaxID=1971748 RepID=UPI0017DA5346|nr:hypothetical protein [Nitrososphaera sp.]NWG37833.1 hypothetical protein [Nitrososphaera sp.]
MSVNLIIRTIAALMAVGMGIYIALPMMHGMKIGQDWSNVPDEGIVVRDGVYTVFLMLAVPLLGIVFLWGFIASGRKDGQEAW